MSKVQILTLSCRDRPGIVARVTGTLNILVAKKQAVHRQDGPRYVYQPAIPQDTARAAAIRHVINTFFGGSAEDAAVALLQMSDTRLPAETVDKLARAVQKARKEGR